MACDYAGKAVVARAIEIQKRALAKFCFLRLVLNRAKNIPVLVSTTHRKPEYLEMSRTFAR